MATPRLTRDAVFQACQAAASEAGRTPTLREVEMRCPTGSKTTIHRYWQEWKAEAAAAAVQKPGTAIPLEEADHHLLAEIKRLAKERAEAEARAAVTAEVEQIRAEAAGAIEAAEDRAARAEERTNDAESRLRETEAELRAVSAAREQSEVALSVSAARHREEQADHRRALEAAAASAAEARSTIAAQAQALQIGQEQLKAQSEDLTHAQKTMIDAMEKLQALESIIDRLQHAVEIQRVSAAARAEISDIRSSCDRDRRVVYRQLHMIAAAVRELQAQSESHGARRMSIAGRSGKWIR
jgi:chromosome segregation ATPase